MAAARVNAQSTGALPKSPQQAAAPSVECRDGGRWERKKQATREALIVAAGELFAERGFAGTTVQQITNAADVSERTFFRYFASKEDLLLTDLARIFAAAVEALGQRPLDEAPLEAMFQAVRSAVLGYHRSSSTGVIEALGAAAELAPSGLIRLFVRWEEEMARALVRRFEAGGADPRSTEVQLRAAVGARTGIAAMRSTLWLLRSLGGRRPASTQRIATVLRQAIDVAAEGCAAPHASPARRAAGARREPAAARS